MRPPIERETRLGWITLAGTAVLCLAVIGWTWSSRSSAADELRVAKLAHDNLGAPRPDDAKKKTVLEDYAKHVQEQAQSNLALHRTTQELQKESGFTLHEPFVLPKDVTQPGAYFHTTLLQLRDQLSKQAEHRIANYGIDLGFSTDTPDDSQAKYLLAILQLTEKAVKIALRTPTPLQALALSHPNAPAKLSALEQGPDNRAPLMREYPLTLQATGSLEDILFILHQLTVREGAEDYPLILKDWEINGKNLKEVDQIKQLDVTFYLAGMQFLTDQERDEAVRITPGLRPQLNAAASAAIRSDEKARP